jgi:PAS domain S-box-containing protein
MDHKDRGQGKRDADRKTFSAEKFVSLQDALIKAQKQFIQEDDRNQVFDGLLSSLLDYTDSEFGFIGEVNYEADGTPYQLSRAISNLGWDEHTRRYYTQNWRDGLRFENGDTLHGAILKSGKVVISNDPAHDPRSKGVPSGHPAIHSFLGIPIYHKDSLIGSFGLANRPGGYDSELVHELQPIVSTCSVIISALKMDEDRKQAEDKLKKQKLLFETIFNTIPDGVVITNTRREIQLANRGMESTFGYKPEDLIGKSTEMLYADRSKYIQIGDSVFNKSAINPEQLYVTRYRDKNGREFPGETFGAKLFDENNQWIGNLGVMRDITEREQAEMRVQQAQKIESIGNLAGGIAHDFNNILFPIVGMAELLLEDLAPDSQEYANAEEIYRAGKRGSDLVKQILAFSRQSEHKMMPVRIQQVLKEVVKLCRSTIPANIEINHNISTDCGMVMADAAQIHQIAMNLITNAYHAVEPTSEKIFVQLRETALERDDVAHSLLQPGRYVMLSVSDTGCGIDPKIVNKIFDPYFTTKEQGKGTGLGLAVVYGIVKEHHGDIKVYSEVGKGTTFNVYLPLMEESSEPVSVEKTESLSAGNEHILLVDDEEPIMRLEKQILERLGYHVTSRISSVDALAAFKANPEAFDLVITDMAMPNMTGDQFARILLSMRTDLPIIICTGFSERITQEKAAAFGIKGLLKKPIVKSELARMIRKVLDEAK